MEVTLAQLVQMAPELGALLRDDVRQGRLPATRKRGVAGRPYVLRTEDLEASGRPEYRELADSLERSPEMAVTRAKRSLAPTPLIMRAEGSELFDIVESQHMMLKDLVQVLTEEMRGRYDRIDRQQMQMQELSYKLGQAHQEIARLERLLAERNFSRVDEAK
ncbi:MAG: hypothetical protein OWU84_06805 [Firmicutes bacterium]|nr:hypothetical protein [Bacillota bacterium]